eukprot:TRINITY_DN11667_c0_g2_i1.p1 TRINITY_DN11667_c0_g2~~TRINITY_DN11667_c0_g2_i1.p1  ORF type:complete len:575 (+),score=77.61 TRINITY_DN11667_c0_g2_i1:142-1725(+)
MEQVFPYPTPYVLASLSKISSFEEQLHDILEDGRDYQTQQKIYYDAGEQAQFRGPEVVRCKPSLTTPTKWFQTSCQQLAILVHGFTACPAVWNYMQLHLKEKGFCVLQPTLPGHGYKPQTSQEYESVTISIDKPTWSQINGLPEGQVFSEGERHIFFTGLVVKNISCEGKCLEITDVKPGKFFQYNTFVSRFEQGENLDMILPGDVIQNVEPDVLYEHARISSQGDLYFEYPNGNEASDYWSTSRSHINIVIRRQKWKDSLEDLPTDKTWPAYIDFAEKLAKLAVAFKEERPSGTVIMAGHSLGAAMAAATMVHAAAHRPPGSDPVFDQVLMVSPSFGLNKNYGWAVKSLGTWFRTKVRNMKCEKTIRTLGVGGYCNFDARHVNAINAFGTYALCSLFKDKMRFWCGSSFKERPRIKANAPIAANTFLVKAAADPAIDTQRFRIAAAELAARLGEQHSGMCYLSADAGHSFLTDLDGTEERDFWWKDSLYEYFDNFLTAGAKLPLEPRHRYMCDLRHVDPSVEKIWH